MLNFKPTFELMLGPDRLTLRDADNHREVTRAVVFSTSARLVGDTETLFSELTTLFRELSPTGRWYQFPRILVRSQNGAWDAIDRQRLSKVLLDVGMSKIEFAD